MGTERKSKQQKQLILNSTPAFPIQKKARKYGAWIQGQLLNYNGTLLDYITRCNVTLICYNFLITLVS